MSQIMCAGLVILMLTGKPLAAQRNDRAEALRGLRSVSVVMLASPGLVSAGLDTAAIRTAIEVELRRDGVPIGDTPPTGSIETSVTGMVLSNNGGRRTGFAHFVEFTFKQTVSVPSNPTHTWIGEVWATPGWFGVSGPDISEAQERIHADVRSDAERFANDWLRVHPRTVQAP